VRIPFLIGLLMVDAVGGYPENRSSLEGQRAAPGEEVLHPPECPVAAVGEEPVIGHADAEHAGDAVEHGRGHDGAGVGEEEGRNGAGVKDRHRRRRDPVHARLVLPAV
jgi:hypothetical protein